MVVLLKRCATEYMTLELGVIAELQAAEVILDNNHNIIVLIKVCHIY